jgi:prenyl protein peptidase
VLAAGFVSSIYLWPSSLELSRDDPRLIIRRFASIICWCVASPALVWYWSVDDGQLHSDGQPLTTWLGLPSHGYLLALFFPLLLTASLFAGPLFVNWLDGHRFSFSLGDSYAERLITLRNVWVGPLCEEWCFRACMCPVLIAGGFSFTSAILGSPLLFGCAHLHHLIEHVRKRGVPMQQGIIMVAFQLMYTTIFGVYATYLFVRTGHFVAAFVAHAFCNVMGFPDLSWLQPDSHLAASKTRSSS